MSPAKPRRHHQVLGLYLKGVSLHEISQRTGLSRQTIWRITREAKQTRSHGGLRVSRCKIPTSLNESLRVRIRIYRQDGEPYAEKAVEWLRTYHQVVVTPAAIYSWISRRRLKNRRG
ncbi:helix-turn-helix domain-containing protein [Lacunisphaera limnophila]|uniref:helix-turn-helix domain-containing protein n=1 Tax=Lacunisphaera limnophila TaxID=1838286 RepID=UPI0009F380F6